MFILWTKFKKERIWSALILTNIFNRVFKEEMELSGMPDGLTVQDLEQQWEARNSVNLPVNQQRQWQRIMALVVDEVERERRQRLTDAIMAVINEPPPWKREPS